MTDQPQWIVTLPDCTELLISFWGGIDEDPQAALHIYHGGWGPPLPVRALPAFPEQRGGAA